MVLKIWRIHACIGKVPYQEEQGPVDPQSLQKKPGVVAHVCNPSTGEADRHISGACCPARLAAPAPALGKDPVSYQPAGEVIEEDT